MDKVGITFSTFDLLHAGHIGMLREARANCDYLIVGLQSDPTIDRPDTKNRPIQTMVERYAQLNEYKEKEFSGKDICRKRGIKLHFNKRDHRFSTSDLRKRVCDNQK